MGACRLAIAAAVAALAASGCGGDEPAPFKEVKQPSTTTSAPTPSVATGSEDPLAALTAGQRKALASLVTAQAALAERGDAVASANTDADKLVQKADEGFASPSGSAPEVRRLAAALTAFGTAVDSIAGDPDLLPQLSTQLQLRFTALQKEEPTAAAHVLDAKQQVDSIIQALPGLRLQLDNAISRVKTQRSEVELDASVLSDAIDTGAESATAALNGVNQAVEIGVRALAESS
jgi:hypothetical protein